MESWRKKAIKVLEDHGDLSAKIAIEILRNGKGYLTCDQPIRVKFFYELGDDDNADE